MRSNKNETLPDEGFKVGDLIAVIIPQEKKSLVGYITGFTTLGAYVLDKTVGNNKFNWPHSGEWFPFNKTRMIKV